MLDRQHFETYLNEYIYQYREVRSDEVRRAAGSVGSQ